MVIIPKISGATITTWVLDVVSVLLFFFTGRAIALLTVIAQEPLLQHTREGGAEVYGCRTGYGFQFWRASYCE